MLGLGSEVDAVHWLVSAAENIRYSSAHAGIIHVDDAWMMCSGKGYYAFRCFDKTGLAPAHEVC